MISYAIALLFRVIYLIIIVVVLMSWIQIFDTRKEPAATLIKIYNAIMAPFKAIIPPIGMIDISPIVAFIVLSLVKELIISLLVGLGL